MTTTSYAAFPRTDVQTVTASGSPSAVYSDIAALPDGGFIIVYGSQTSPGDPNGPIRARVYNADGTPRTDEIIISTVDSGHEQQPHIAVAPNGQIGIVFLSTDGGTTSLRMQFLDQNFNPIGDDQSVPITGNGSIGAGANSIDIAATSSGDFIITAADATQGVHRVVINGVTHAAGTEAAWALPHAATVAQAVLTNGDLVTVASDVVGVGGSNLYSWAPETARDLTGAFNDTPAIGVLPGGGYALAYSDSGDISLMIVNGDGSVRTGPVVANAGAVIGTQDTPAISVLANGMIAVFWHHVASGVTKIGSAFFDANGIALTSSLEIDIDAVQLPSAATLANGSVALTWSNVADGTIETRVIDFVRLLTGDASAETITGDALADSVLAGGGNDIINTLGGDDIIAGEDGNDTINAGAGDDLIFGGAGNDVIDGGSGIDTVQAEADVGAVDFNLATGVARDGWGTIDTLVNIENAIGSSFSDVLTGDGGANVLEGRGGADILNGGAGRDTASYAASASAVTVSLLTGTGSGGDAAGDTLSNIENLEGSAFNDALTGDANSNWLYGNAGNDALDGGSGADLLVGGLGNDVYVVDNAGDIVTELVGEGRDTVFTSTGVVIGSELRYTLSANVEDLAVSGFAGAINLFGNALANLIVGNGAVNALDGGAGADMLIGGGGNDLYFVDNIADVIIENAGEGRDTVYTSIAYYSLGDNEIEDVVITGSAGCYVVGNALANLMVGGVGADALDGGAGADFMVGGAGNDTYFVDNIGDVLVESAGGGRDTVYVALSYYSLGDNEIEDAVVATSGGAYVIGNGLANLMVGGAGADALDGGAGADFMVGGGGNDSYFVDNLGDTVIESVGEGRDTVYASISYTLGDTEVEDLALLGSGNISAGGNGLANLLVGNGGANVLWGRGGSDTLVGGAGADRFAYMAASEGGDVITDFVSGVDKIQVSAPGFGGGLTAGGAVTLRTGASPTASGTNGQFLYNTSNGQLYWDADGTNGGAAVLLATLSGAPAISASDFVVTDGSSNPLSVGDGGIELMAMSAKDADPAPEILPAYGLDDEPLIAGMAISAQADASPATVIDSDLWSDASGSDVLAAIDDVHLVRGDMGAGVFDPTDFSDLVALGAAPRPEWAVIEQ
ncbi:MAG: calcium-binding protein [Hyphomonadaceae bacterium]